jgi:hypothetical protein
MFVIFLNQMLLLQRWLRTWGSLIKEERSYCYSGRARKQLDRNYYYLVEKDLNFIAEVTANTNVGFVNLLERYDEPWINKRVRNMNL